MAAGGVGFTLFELTDGLNVDTGLLTTLVLELGRLARYCGLYEARSSSVISTVIHDKHPPSANALISTWFFSTTTYSRPTTESLSPSALSSLPVSSRIIVIGGVAAKGEPDTLARIPTGGGPELGVTG
jgi:hypothetical protein